MTGQFQLIHGNCLEKLRELPDRSVDCVITDPPYELGFMGKKWDASGIAYNVDMWRECLRVLKPGGHLAAFSATRTYHRMACAIEDAGFEIRDQIAWCYGSGFPKSLDVSKAIDKASGEKGVSHYSGPNGKNKVYGDNMGGGLTAAPYEPASEAAKKWQGWGTALKPAWEPIVLARSPFKGSVVNCVLKNGTGAINVDACRVPYADAADAAAAAAEVLRAGKTAGDGWGMKPQDISAGEYLDGSAGKGRWPANLLHDGSDEVVACFPDDGFASAARFFYTAKATTDDREAGLDGFEEKLYNTSVQRASQSLGLEGTKGRGSSSRPYRKNIHPTVKPTDLMVWLVRLLCPKGGVVLDQFMGSGSTGRAAAICNVNFIGIDMTAEYIPIAQARIDDARGELFTFSESKPTTETEEAKA